MSVYQESRGERRNRLLYPSHRRPEITIANRFLRDCYETEMSNLSDDQVALLLAMLMRWRLDRRKGRRPKVCWRIIRMPMNAESYGKVQLAVLEYLWCVRMDSHGGVLEHLREVGFERTTKNSLRDSMRRLVSDGLVLKGTLDEVLGADYEYLDS